jgi:Do/DeqQ family serine protease
MRKTVPLAIVFVLGLAGSWWLARLTAPPIPGPPVSSPIASAPPAASAETRGLPTLAPTLRRVMPAVVSITVQARAPAEDNPLYKDPFYRRYFGDQLPAERQILAAGSGVVIDAERGLVLTNNHVVRNAQRIGVALSDGRRIEAKFVGADPPTDLALLRITAQGLVGLALEDSDKLEIGDYVVAIGNPFGLGQTVTFGVISALGRSGLGIEGYEDFIQTDAAVNPGNSGGALVDIDGHLVGINTAIVGPAGGNIGIGFAIPSNMVRQVAEQLARAGKVNRGQLGISIQDHPGAMPTAMQAESPTGAMVAEVAPGSPADKAGLRRGGIIIAVDGRPIVSAGQLRARVGLIPVGQSVELEVLRDGTRVKLNARVAVAAFSGSGDRADVALAATTL